MPFERISIEQARQVIEQGNCRILDIRDEQSYSQAHIPAAVHVDNSNLAEIIDETDKSTPMLIYCYHGNSSQSAAAYFEQQGFEQVFSVDGGFDAWQRS